jgi:cbb3-type cytochrome oxidase subunit 3
VIKITVEFIGILAAQGVDASFTVLFICCIYYLFQARTQRSFKPTLNKTIKQLIIIALATLLICIAISVLILTARLLYS